MPKNDRSQWYDLKDISLRNFFIFSDFSCCSSLSGELQIRVRCIIMRAVSSEHLIGILSRTKKRCLCIIVDLYTFYRTDSRLTFLKTKKNNFQVARALEQVKIRA